MLCDNQNKIVFFILQVMIVRMAFPETDQSYTVSEFKTDFLISEDSLISGR